ncbi:MAG: hypothetical protein PVF68_15080 [Acidobacteriota bacterium]|jgi:hypothetical protein
MRWFVAMLIGVGAPSMGAECPTIGGVDAVIRPGTVLVLGQLYGTAESPEFVRDVACHATAADLPVVVGVELPAGERGRIELFLDSTGAPGDRESLISGPPWQSDPQDGRTSFAMLQLIDGLRWLRAAGKSIRVVPFDTGGAGDDPPHERGMGGALAAAAKAAPDSMMVVLAGNVHTRPMRGRASNADHEPMAYVLARQIPGRDVITLDVAHGPGSAWNCSSGCGPVEVLGTEGDWRWTVQLDETMPPDGHHGRYFIGDVTASPPARGGAATVPVDETPWVRRRTGWTPDDWSPPAAPPRAMGDLTAAEQLFQGDWQSYLYESGKRSWKMRFEGRSFHAEGGGGTG